MVVHHFIPAGARESWRDLTVEELVLERNMQVCLVLLSSQAAVTPVFPLCSAPRREFLSLRVMGSPQVYMWCVGEPS